MGMPDAPSVGAMARGVMKANPLKNYHYAPPDEISLAHPFASLGKMARNVPSEAVSDVTKAPMEAPRLGPELNPPGESMKIPVRMPKAEQPIDPVAAAIKQGIASRVPTRMPTPKAAAIAKGLGDIASEPRSTGSEGRPATWTNEAVTQMASKGNRDAIAQAVRRGMQLPENARYVAGDADYPRAVLNPREVTKFAPDGTPIRNLENAQAQNPSSGARIQKPEMPAARVEQAAPELTKAARIGEGAVRNRPEWTAQQFDAEITRAKGILRNPDATPEEQLHANRVIESSREMQGAPESHQQLTDKLAEIEEAHTSGQGVSQDDLDHGNELADEFEGKPQASQTDIKGQIAKARTRYNQYSDKMANARNSQTANRYMRQMQALEQKATRLERALKTGEGVAPELKGATRAELSQTYSGADANVRATADYLADLYNKSEYGAKADFESHYGLKSGATKGLPIKERLARFLTTHPEEVADYVKEFGSSSETKAGRP
jgi:hypothetical protein